MPVSWNMTAAVQGGASSIENDSFGGEPGQTDLSYNRFMKAPRPVEGFTCQRIGEVWRRLGEEYGHPTLHPTGDPVGELVLTILSQHTTDASSSRAYAELRSQYPDWAAVETAPLDDLARAIRTAGLAMQKATTIQTALRELDGSDVTNLAAMPVTAARAVLTSVRGIGEKTASCVLLFALGMPAQPVDTHIERVSRRVGFSNGERTPTGIQRVLETCLPADGQTMFAFHVDLIRHGREICTAKAPKCAQCMLSDICAFYAQVQCPSA
jgi:endonuclease-3